MKRRTGIQKRFKRLLAYLLLLAVSPTTVAGEGDIKMVVTAAFVSERGLPIYGELAKYVGDKLGHKTDLISGLNYAEANALLARGIIQMGFICGLPYIHGKAEGRFDLLAIPVIATSQTRPPDSVSYAHVPGKYFSYTIVRKNSALSSWQSLRGKRYVYNEQDSNSGYNMPRYKLVQLGAKSWDEYFAQVQVSGSHEESVRMVSRGAVDASSVDSLVLDYMRLHGDPDALNVKVIETLFPGGAGIPPVVINTRTDPALRHAIQTVLLNMDKDPEGRRILGAALLQRFDPPDDANYDDVRAMEAAAKQAGFRDHEESHGE